MESGGDATMWSWTGPNGFSSSVQNPIIAVPTAANSGIYTVVVTDGNSCQNSCTVDITVNPVPIPNNTSLDACDENGDGNAVFTLTDADSAILNGQTGMTVSYHLTYTRAMNNEFPISSPYSIATGMNGVIASRHARIEDNVTGCFAIANIQLGAFPTPSLLDASVCAGSTVNMVGSGTAATVTPYSSADTSIATVTSTGVVTGVMAGTTDITFINNNGCQATATITVITIPIATNVAIAVCDDDTDGFCLLYTSDAADE